jgi:hypothetical protein
VTRALDVSLYALLGAFAWWTVLYEIALVTGLSLWVAFPVWVVGCVIGAAVSLLWLRHRGRAAESGPRTEPESEVDRRDRSSSTTWRVVRWPARVVLALALTVVVALHRSSELLLLLVLALLLVLIGLADALMTRRASDVVASRSPHGPAPSRWEEATALVLAVAAAVFSSLLLNTDADDAYYVNRSVWVAQHGTAALRDTIFGPETFRARYGAGLPVASVEGLLGALAHALGVAAGSVTYLLAVPVVAFYFVWALWLLLRLWAPRWPAIALAVALLFIVMSGAGVIGNYAFGRLWQGKVMALTVVVPVLWAVATRLATRRHGGDLVLMAVLGISFVGLSSTAALLGPIVAGALLVAAAALRSGRLAVGALLFVAAPLANGLAVALGSTATREATSMDGVAWGAYELVFGHGVVLLALAVVALALGPSLARRGAAAVLAAAACAVPFVVLLPGVISVVQAVTGAGPVLWRLLLATPIPVMVGMLAVAPAAVLPRTGQDLRARVLPTMVVASVAAVALVLVGFGSAIWSSQLGATLTSRPEWKVNQQARPVADRIAALHPPAGPVLLPHTEMAVLPLVTTRMFAVVPRLLYAQGVDRSPAKRKARLALYDLVQGRRPLPSFAETDEYLQRLDVSMVCVNRDRTKVRQRVRAAGYLPQHRVEQLVCLVRQG